LKGIGRLFCSMSSGWHRCFIPLVEEQIWRPILIDDSRIKDVFDGHWRRGHVIKFAPGAIGGLRYTVIVAKARSASMRNDGREIVA
jgi:hypothetical protein